MENSAGKSSGAKISRKNRSLDIHSLYKSSVPKKERNNKRKNSAEDDGEIRKKKRKIRKEVSLSSFEPGGKKSRNNINEANGDGVSLDLSNSEGSVSGLSQKLYVGRGINRISLNLEDGGDAVRIPKHRGGPVTHKKCDNNRVSRPLGSSSSRVSGSASQISKLSGEFNTSENCIVSKRLRHSTGGEASADHLTKFNAGTTGKFVTPMVKAELGCDELKDSRNARVSLAQHDKVEDDHPIVDNGDVSSRNHHGTCREKSLEPGSKSLAKTIERWADGLIKLCKDSHDEDEENLEQNAARMLSSRFDPSCTSCLKTRRCGSSTANGLSFCIPSDEDFDSQGGNSFNGLDSVSADIASRVLRPRKNHKVEGLLRKRRHFYEILSRDLDAYWVLKRRIKVFWPLDESWYYGLVNDYDPERKLHHIKYDDRDEEWVNLCNERFKLLLLRSEVPSKTDPVRATLSNNHQGNDLTTDDDSLIGSYMESEPIISWLARASCRVSSSALGVSKRRKAFHTSPDHLPHILSSKSDDVHGCLNVDSSKRSIGKPPCGSAFLDRYTNSSSILECTDSTKDGKLPVVYYRRRFRYKDKALENKKTCTSGTATATSAPTFHGFHAFREDEFSIGHIESEGLLWSVDNFGLLKLTIPLGEYREFKFELGSLIPVFCYTFDAKSTWLLHAVLLFQHGVLIKMWPKVLLEMLFVDNDVGLRFLLFEGCLKQALAFVFLVLTVLHLPTELGKYVHMQMPVTSIRFKISSIEDIRKQHMFVFYGFSRVKYSKWLYLDFKLQQHCFLSKQLPLSECTYDNVKALGGGSNKLSLSFYGRKPAFEDIMPMGASALRESWSVGVSRSSSLPDSRHGKLFPFIISFAAAPTFFLILHLKLLMENCVASINLRDHASVYSFRHSENGGNVISDGCNVNLDCSKTVLDITLKASPSTSSTENRSSGLLPCAKSWSVAETISKCNGSSQFNPSQNLSNGKFDVNRTPMCSQSAEEIPRDVIVQSQIWRCSHSDLKQFVELPQHSVANDQVPVIFPDTRCCSNLTGLSVEIPSAHQVEGPVTCTTPGATECIDLTWSTDGSIVQSSHTTGPRSMWYRKKNSSLSSFGDALLRCTDEKADFMPNGFGNGPKKPRSQVKYASPLRGLDFCSKQKMHNQRGLPFRCIRKSDEKRASNASKTSRRNLELLACEANVLITIEDKGWRVCGARIILERADHNEWSLAVKLFGATKYSYKAHQFMQPGFTNRYTHAMIWKGGKDWALEFTDRIHWMLFKEMHEECYNRNARAASVKNIPIPGVHVIEECDDNGTEFQFLHSSPRFIRQVETDIDIAMNPSRILYDMDSDDERWILEIQESKHSYQSDYGVISEELFQRAMDMFEKVAYAQQCDCFTDNEIEDFMAGIGPMEVMKSIHEHWRLKRQRIGMPLIRHLQPPLWERYEQQVKEWKQAMAKSNSIISNGCREKAASMEKPPMFAFCLKPRGLEVPNKGSKQRSQRKFLVSGHNHGVQMDQDICHAFGRRSNGFSFGDDEVVFLGNSLESSDASPVFLGSGRVFSPRDANGFGHFSLGSDWSEWYHHPKLYRDKSKKVRKFPSPYNAQMGASYNQRTTCIRNGVHWWNARPPEWSNQHNYKTVSVRHGIEELDGSDLDEFRLHDASGAAKHALNMAKLKREKAQRLLYRADLAIHKAVVALMTADAIKASFEESNGDG